MNFWWNYPFVNWRWKPVSAALAERVIAEAMAKDKLKKP